MKILLKAMETEEDLTRFMNFCEAHDIDAMARSNGTSLSLDMINFENGSINWGGYGSGFSVGPNLFSYFKLAHPGGDPPRGKSFAHVKMVISGRLSGLDVDDVTAKVEAEGAWSSPQSTRASTCWSRATSPTRNWSRRPKVWDRW